MGLLQNDVRRKLVGDLLLKHNLSLLNDGSYTYLHPTTGSSSAVDLSIATQSLYLDFSWQVITDQHGSDQFPVGIHSYTTTTPPPKLLQKSPGSCLKLTGPPFVRKLL